MASTPEQRQLDERAAFSARFGLSRVHVLAAVAALVVTAVTASVVLAQLAGWRTPERPATPGFLATALGAPQADAPLVREPDAGIRVTIGDRGFRLASERGSLGLALEGVNGEWTRYRNGVARGTDLGVETITVDGETTEQSLVVTSRHGVRTWRWRLDSELDPRVTPEGWVGFFDGPRLADLAIAPVAIYDVEGREITPDAATWSVVERQSTNWLELALDDRGLPLPYVIDPIALRTAGAAVTSTGTTISPVIPATVRQNDVLLLHVSVASGTTPTQPTGWSTVANSSLGNNNMSQAVFRRNAAAGDASTTVDVTIPAAVAAGYIEVYKGADTTAAIQTVASTSANSRSPTCPSLTTTVANQIAICSSAIRAAVTYPATNNSFTLRNAGANTIELAQYDRVMASAGATGTTTFANLAATSSRWVGHTLALTPDTNNPTHGTIALSGVSPSGVAYTNGTTIYYRGSTAGQFQIQDPATDTQSAVESVNYPATTGAWTHANETVTAATTYMSSAYSYTAVAAAPVAGQRTLTATDGFGNTSTLVVPFVSDTTAPTAGALTVNGTAASAGGSTSFSSGTSVTIGTRTDYTETQSGTAAGLAISVLTREDGTLSANSCSDYGAPTTITGNPNQTGLTTGCYRFTLTGTDNVGNAVSITTTVKVDTSGPSISSVTVGSLSNTTDSAASGSTFYYRPAGAGGTFAVSTAASDGDSGLGNATYPALAGGFTPASSADIAPPSPYSRTYTWPATTGTDGGPKTVSVANNAGGASTHDFRIVSDSTAPAGGAVTVNSVAAGGAGTTSYDTTGSFTIGTRTDYAETQSGTAAGLRSSTLTREDGTLSADACSSYGGPATLVGTPAQNGLATGCYRYTLTGTDNVGNTVTVSTVVKVDTTAPTSAADVLPTYAVSTSITVGYTASDATTGVDSVQLWVDGPGAGGYALADTDTTPASPSFSFTAADGDGTYRFYTRARDVAGNTEPAPGSEDAVTVLETSPPTAPSLSFGSFTNASATGTTVYVREGASGGFTVTADATDPDSGVESHAFPSFWGEGGSVASDPAGTAYTFGTSDAAPAGAQTVTATNGAGFTGAGSSFTVVADTLAPVTTPSAAPAANGFGWHTASPVSFTLIADDGGSGVKEIRYTTDGSVPGPTSPLYSAPVDVVALGTTTVTFRAEDNVGNLEAPATIVVRVDTTAPTTPTLSYSAFANASFDGTVTWFRPGVAGGFTVTPSASDPESGIASHAFPTIGSGWSNTGGTYAFTAAAADPVEPNEIVTTNGAGLASAGAPITVTGDSTAPVSTATCNTVACSAGWYTTKPVTIVLTASDVQSGLDRVDWSTDGSAPANEYLGPLSLGAEGTATVRFSARDNVGNVETAVSQDVRIDTVAPTAAIGAVAPYLRGTVALTSTQSDATSGVGSVQFQIAPSGTGTWTNVPATWDTTGTANGEYDVRVRVTDVAGNVTDSTPVASRWADNLAPTITLDPPASPGSGPVLLTSTANDAHSGLDTIEYAYSAAGANDWRTTALTGALWDTTQLADGAYDLRGRATDRSGNVSGWSLVNGIAVDNAPPTVSVTAPLDGSFVNAADADPFTLAAAASDAGTGVASVEFLACATVSPTCSSWTSVDLDTTSAYTGSWTLPSDGERQVKAVATDNAGHTAEAVVTVTVDRTAPVASLTAPSAGANVRGTIGLTASATDATSGVTSVAFQRSPAGASSWTTISSDTDGGDGWTGSLDTTVGGTPDGLYDLRVFVTDEAGNTQTDAAANVRVDNTAPTGTLTDPGQFLRSSLGISGTAADTGSGVDSVAFQRSPESADTWTTIATDTNGADGWSTSFDTAAGGTPDGHYDLRVLVTDNAGNTFVHALPGRTIDNTKPTAAIASAGANLRLTVTLGGTADDVTAGVATVAFEYDNGGGWQLISTDSDGSDGWSASLNTTLPATPDGLYAFRLTATDRAGNQETSQIVGRRIDNTAPTASLTDPGPYLMGAAQLTASATDSGSGIEVVRFERSPAGSGGPWAQVGPDASLSGGSWRTTWNTNPDGLYDLRVVVDDVAGNRTIDVVASRRVDNTAPVTTDDAAAGRHNTDQTVTLSRSDAGSGPSATQYRVRPPGGSFGAWLSGTSVTILASGGDGVWTIEYYSTDAAGNVESVKSTDVLIDTTGPTGTVTDPSTFLHGLVTLTATADDPTDVSSVKFEYAPAGTSAWTQIGTDLTANGSDEYTIDWDTTTVAGIAYDLQVTFLDSLGNPTVQSLAAKTVDNELPTIALTAPPAGAVRRNVIAITANAVDGVSGMREVRFEVKPAGAAGFSQIDVDNGSSPYSTAWDSTASPDGPTDLRVIAVDQAGNLRSATTTIFVDNNAPTLTVSAPSTAVSGTVTLTATGSSDIQSVLFEVGGSPIGTDNDGSDGFSVAWSTVGNGNQVVTAAASDVGGNVGTSSPVTVQVDNTAPTGVMTMPGNGATVSGTIDPEASASDAGSGVSGTSFEFKRTSDSTWTAIGGSSWNTTAVAAGAYNLRARITDNAGNSALTAAITVHVVPPAPVVVPPAPPAVPPATPAPSDPAPSIVASTPADGSMLTTSPASIDVTGSEPLSAVAGLTLNGIPVAATIAGASFSVEPDELETGAYTLAGTLVDATGKTTPFRLHFTVVIGSPTTLPFVEANAPASGATSLTAVDGASVVTVRAGAVSGGGDWLVIRIQPLPGSSVPAATTGAPVSVVDVSARWALAETEVHSFLVPLEIVVTGASASLVPATFEDGRWRALEPVPGGASLPLLSRDGYIREGDRVRILTRHLSVFALIPAPRLVLSVAAAKTFSWSTRRYVAARVKVSRAATVTATLVGPRGGRLATWRRNLRAGASVVKLPMPWAARTPGAYRIVFAASAGGQRAQRTFGLRVVRKDGSQRTPGPVQVALAGDTRIRRTLALGLRGTRTRLIAADADGAFALAANRGIRVVLVDVDRHGTALVRDLNTVFPTLRLLALASRSADIRAATRAGADAALPRSASAGRIARVVRRLAR